MCGIMGLVLTSATMITICCLLRAHGGKISGTFGVIGYGKQLKNFGKISAFHVDSNTDCAAACLKNNSKCGSFSFTREKKCTVNVLRLPQDDNGEIRHLLDEDEGTFMYARISGAVMPHGNIAVRETANYSYLLSLISASWYEALEICQQFGNGFYLANIDDVDEWNSLHSWLTGVTNTGSMGHIWVSGTDEGHEGCWVWASPAITKVSHDVQWYVGDPNNAGNNEHCMILLKNANLHFADYVCAENAYYLCKRAVDGTTHSVPTADQARATDIC